MTNREFIDYIKTQESYQKILEEYNPYIVYLGGSRALNHNTENSDYDIIMLVDDTDKEVYNHFTFVNKKISNDKNLHTHAFIWPLTKYLDFLSYTLHCRVPSTHIILACLMNFSGEEEFRLHTRKDLDPKILNIIKFLKANRKKIVEIALYNLLNELRFELKVLNNGGTIEYNHKIYYHLLTGYDFINNTDSSNLIKKIREKSILNDSDIIEFNNKINYLYNFFLNYKESNYDTFRAEVEVILWHSKK